MRKLYQSTARVVIFFMVDETDHVTGLTGLTVTVTLSKNGGAFAAAGGAVAEISSGWYKVSLNTTDTNTLGDLGLHCTATGADPTDFACEVFDYPTERVAMADAAFHRETSAFENTVPKKSLGAAVIGATHKCSVDAGTGVQTIFESDDASAFATRTSTPDASLDPIQALTKLA